MRTLGYLRIAVLPLCAIGAVQCWDRGWWGVAACNGAAALFTAFTLWGSLWCLDELRDGRGPR